MYNANWRLVDGSPAFYKAHTFESGPAQIWLLRCAVSCRWLTATECMTSVPLYAVCALFVTLPHS